MMGRREFCYLPAFFFKLNIFALGDTDQKQGTSKKLKEKKTQTNSNSLFWFVLQTLLFGILDITLIEKSVMSLGMRFLCWLAPLRRTASIFQGISKNFSSSTLNSLSKYRSRNGLAHHHSNSGGKKKKENL